MGDQNGIPVDFRMSPLPDPVRAADGESFQRTCGTLPSDVSRSFSFLNFIAFWHVCRTESLRMIEKDTDFPVFDFRFPVEGAGEEEGAAVTFCQGDSGKTFSHLPFPSRMNVGTLPQIDQDRHRGSRHGL